MIPPLLKACHNRREFQSPVAVFFEVDFNSVTRFLSYFEGRKPDDSMISMVHFLPFTLGVEITDLRPNAEIFRKGVQNLANENTLVWICLEVPSLNTARCAGSRPSTSKDAPLEVPTTLNALTVFHRTLLFARIKRPGFSQATLHVGVAWTHCRRSEVLLL
jgi:hypothetical protein